MRRRDIFKLLGLLVPASWLGEKATLGERIADRLEDDTRINFDRMVLVKFRLTGRLSDREHAPAQSLATWIQGVTRFRGGGPIIVHNYVGEDGQFIFKGDVGAVGMAAGVDNRFDIVGLEEAAE